MVSAMTRLYCVIGNPIKHSLSPYLHNLSFKLNNISAVYSSFEVKDIEKFIDCVRSLPIMGISVTIPYKETVMKFLDEIDKEALEIGAVNTILNKDGKLIGYNTDGRGAILSLCEKTTLHKKNVLILGYGGSAKAISYSLLKEGINSLTISGRNKEKANSLISYLKKIKPINISFLSIYEKEALKKEISKVDIIINTTPVGMFPNVDFSPLFEDCFVGNRIYMDIVYNPLETKFLKLARGRGGETITGEKMFVYQAIEQERIWFGIEVDAQFLINKVREKLIQDRKDGYTK